MRKLFAGTTAFVTLAALSIVAAPSAIADTGDGTLTVTVVKDVNHDNTRDAGDAPLPGVEVTITDADGHTVTVTTSAAGVATLAATDAGNTLTGGQYRVSVANPDSANLTEAQVISGHTEPQFVPAVSFVELAAGAAANISVGFSDPTTMIDPDRATIYSAIHPDSVWGQNSGGTEVYSYDYNLTDAEATRITTQGTVGTVYGIGVDPISRDVFAGAYAKRGSAYGPGGPGAIYRIDPATGASTVWTTVPDAGTTAHNITQLGEQDFDFIPAVGRESLGDLDVSKDGKWLTVVNMNTASLVVYPVVGSSPSAVQTLPVVVPSGMTCDTDWAPMGLAENDGKLYVGAVCGSTSEAAILAYDRAGDGTLSLTETVMQSDLTDTAQVPGRNGVVQAILPGVAPADCYLANWRVWNDTIPQACIDSAFFEAPQVPTALTHTPQFSIPQPMLSDMEFLDDGRMVVSFRDRGGDMYGPLLYIGEKTTGQPAYEQYVHAGDALFACPAGSTFTLGCGGPFEGINDANVHPEGAYGGIAYVTGASHFVTNQMDPTGLVDTQGIRRNDVNNGAFSNGHVLTRDEFQKSAGLADIEALVDQATQQIGNRVWIDTDRDGIQDPGEPAVPGVQVSLHDEGGDVVATTVTDANGEYYFDTDDGLRPGTTYIVALDRAADFEPGGPLAGLSPTVTTAGDDTTIDSNGQRVAGVDQAQITSPAAGIDDHSIDFGYVTPLVSIGDYVWIDSDHDGVQDAGETPIPEVEVTLLDADGDEIGSTTTDGDGYYVFTDLEPCTDVTVVFPTEVERGGVTMPLTVTAQGADRAVDSNPSANGEALLTTPCSGANSAEPGEADDPTIDAGYYAPPVSIGDFVWIDADRDGVQDAGESPVPGAAVTLLDADGDEIGSTTTDANGYYAFTDLAPCADVTVVFPTSVTVGGVTYSLTTPSRGGDDAADSNADVATGEAAVTTPCSGDNSGAPGEADDPTIDAGYVTPLVSIGDYVWIDSDHDGVQDAGETPIPEVEVTLLDADGDEIGSTTTDGDGYYVFTDLEPCTDVTVVFPTEVERGGVTMPLTVTAQGADRAVDSNPSANGEASVTTPCSGANSAEPGEADDPTIDAGYYAPPVSIGDYVWIDADRDGVQDAGESPVPGAAVTLLDADGDEIGSTTTDANGYYAFTDLAPCADVTVVFPTSVTVGGVTYSLTTPSRGGDDAADSNADVATGEAAVTTPCSGDNSGAPGEADDPTIDAGYVTPLVSIGDYVWVDGNRNGVQDAGENPIPEVEVTLLDADGDEIGSTTTDVDGYYAFTDLSPCTDVQVVFPTAVTIGDSVHALTEPRQGGDTASDSNADADTGIALLTTPCAGANSAEPGEADDPTIDAGYLAPLVSIGDYVWVDGNRNGVQDAGENPIPEVEVTLLDTDGDEIGSTTTDANGYYAFTDLPACTDVTVVFPTSVTVDGKTYSLTEQTQGGNAAADSDAVVATGRVDLTTPCNGNNSGAPGEADDPTIDAGYVTPLVSIGNCVWIDQNRDGLQTPGEPGVPGVTVRLLDPDGSEVASTTTDSDGCYSFSDLPTGTEYIIEFPKTVPYGDTDIPLTTPRAGTDVAQDSDPDPSTGRVTITTPDAGENSKSPAEADDPTFDAGYVPAEPKVSVGDYVWHDENRDGLQTPGESPIPGVTVTLLDESGAEVGNTLTDKSGCYAFADLTPGASYTVVFPTKVTVDGIELSLVRPYSGSTSSDSNALVSTGKAAITAPSNGANQVGCGNADDPTIDAGYAGPPPLAITGGAVPWIALIGALVLLAAGGGLVMIRRRGRADTM